MGQKNDFNLPLRFHDGNGPFEYESFPVKWNDTSLAFKNTYPEIKGVPGNLKDIKRGIICFDRAQYVYQNFNAGKISKADFAEINKTAGNTFKEKYLVEKAIKCYVNILSATNENNEMVCVIDTNNDFDFSDEVPFMPLDKNTPDLELNQQLKKVFCQRSLNGQVVEDTVPLLIVKRGGSFFSTSHNMQLLLC